MIPWLLKWLGYLYELWRLRLATERLPSLVIYYKNGVAFLQCVVADPQSSHLFPVTKFLHIKKYGLTLSILRVCKIPH